MKLRRIGLFIYGDSRVYPPTINAANILAEKGHEVIIFDIYSVNTLDRINLNQKIKRVPLGHQQTGLKNLIQFFKIIIKLFYFSHKFKLNWLITYDAYSAPPAYISRLLSWKLKWIYHQHDFWEEPKGIFQKIIYFLEYKLVPKANLVSFPQEVRANIFAERSNMKQKPLIIFNGPREQWIRKSNPINQKIFDLKKEDNFLLIYQGGISKYFGLDILIEALTQLDIQAKLIILGKELEHNYIQLLKDLAKKMNISDKVVFWDNYVKYDDLPSITSYCDLGITKLTLPESNAPINDRFLAGASNKIIEYMASGLPIIAANSEDNKNFFKKEDASLLCDVSTSKEIAIMISEILKNPIRREFISKTNKELFFKEYSFDRQFEKLVEKIEE